MDDTAQAQLVERAQGGDPDAYAAIAQAQRTALLGIAYSAVHDWDVAEDLAQDACLAAWQHLQSLRQPERFSMWLKQIVRNLARDWLRNQAYQRRLRERFAQERARRAEPSAGERLEPADAVSRGLESLAVPMREAVVLYYLSGRSVTETAQALEVSPNAVKKRLQKARAKLREQLEEDWGAHVARSADARRRAMAPLLAAGLAAGPACKGTAANACASASYAVSSTMLLSGVAVKAGMAAVAMSICAAAIVLTLNWRAPDPEPPALSLEMYRSPVEEPLEDVRPLHAAPAPKPAEGNVPDPADALGPAAGVAPAAAPAHASVSGVVVHEDGRPAAGAGVALLPVTSITDSVGFGGGGGGGAGLGMALPRAVFTPARVSVDGQDAHAVYRTSTRRDGTFHFEQLDVIGPVLLVGDADGYPTQAAAAVADPEQPAEGIVLEVKSAYLLRGRVVSHTRRPIPDAVVALSGFTDGVVVHVGSPLSQSELAITDAQGRFVIGFERAGTRRLSVRTPEYGTRSFPDIAVGTGDEVELIIEPGAVLEGFVRISEGELPAGARASLTSIIELVARDADGNVIAGGRSSGARYSVAIEPDGSYRFEGLDPAATLTFSVQDAKLMPLSPAVSIDGLKAGEHRRFDYVLDTPIRVTGTVRSEQDGTPLDGLPVRWQRTDAPGTFGWAQTEPDGTYALDIYAGAGQYQFWADAPISGLIGGWSVAKSDWTLRPGAPYEIDLTHPGLTSATIRVVDRDAAPVADAELMAFAGGGYSGASDWRTDEDGRYSFTALPPNAELNIVVRKAGYVTVSAVFLTGDAGAAVPERVVVLQPSGGVSGIALDPDGAPIGEAEVGVFARHAGGVAKAEGRTTAAGLFTIEDGLPAEASTVTIFAVSLDGLEVYRWDGKLPAGAPGELRGLDPIIFERANFEALAAMAQ